MLTFFLICLLASLYSSSISLYGFSNDIFSSSYGGPRKTTNAKGASPLSLLLNAMTALSATSFRSFMESSIAPVVTTSPF